MADSLRFLLLCCLSSGLLLQGCGGSKSVSSTGSPTPTPSGTPAAACPTGGYSASAGALDLAADCQVVGNVSLSGTATLTMTGANLTIEGNLTLSDQAKFSVSGGGLIFPQTNYSQYSINLSNGASLSLTNTVMVTNGTSQNNFSMSLTAGDTSTVDFQDSQLNADISWLLGTFNDSSQLTVDGSTNLPTEAYPGDSSKTTITDSAFAGVWLPFLSGTTATVTVPENDAQGTFDFSFGNTPGFDWSVDMQGAETRLGLNTFPGSTLTVNGHGAAGTSDIGLVFGYYIVDSNAPVTLSGLSVGSNMTLQMTDSGRDLQINNVNMNPFSWQVYVDQSNGFPVTVSNSTINEIAAFTDGLINLSDGVLQLAVLGAEAPGAQVSVTGTQIWSQAIQAANGGKMTVANSQLHGNYVSAVGSGSSITMTGDTDDRNGTAGMSCAPVDGYPPNTAGVPLCNPYNPIGQCSQVATAGGGVVTGTPACN